MSEKEFKYKVSIDTSDVARAAAETRRAFSQEMNRVPIGGPVGSPAGAGGAGGLLGDLGKLRSFLAGGVLGFGVSQLAQVGMQMGMLGAANQRTEKSFEGLASSVGLVSDSLLNKLNAATQRTISDQTLMSRTNLLLVTAQSQQIDITERQIETLAKFSRLRSQQLGINGEEAYSRLIVGISKRETELIDELGLSTRGIAAALNIPVEQVNRSTETFLKGVVALAEKELAGVGDIPLDEAAKIEQASKQMTDAWNRLSVAAAKPVAFVVNVSADAMNVATGTFQGLTDAWDQMQNPASASISQVVDNTRGRMRQAQDSAMGTNVTDDQVVAFQQMREAAERYESALSAINHAEVISQSRIFEGTRDVGERNTALNALHQTLTGVSNAYARLAQLEQAGVVDPASLGQAEGAWQTIVDGITDGTLELDDANAKLSQMLGLLSQISPMIGPAVAGAAKAISPWTQGIMDDWAAKSRQSQVVAGTVPIDELTEAEKKYRLAVGDTTEQQAIYKASLDDLAVGSDEAYAALIKIAGLREQADAQNERTAQEIRDKRQGLLNAQLGYQLTQTDTTGQIALLQAQADTLTEGTEEWFAAQERIANLQIRAAETAETEWKRSAREVERMFEQAADKIMGIPGVTSLTPVTERDMADAELGIYRDKPDEWMHRVRDELLNGVDYPDVTREQVARLAGLPADMPAEALISRVEGRWGTGSLFADPANLDLLNMDAIRGQYEEMKAGAVGRQNQRQYIMEQLGIGAADAALLTGTQAPLVQMLTGGQSTEEIAAQLGGVGEMVSQRILAPQVVVDGPSPLVRMLTGGQSTEEIAAQLGLDGLGTTITERVLAPLQSGGLVKTLSDGWKVDVQDNITLLYGPVDSLASAVNGRLNEKIGDGLHIVDIVVARVLAEIADSL